MSESQFNVERATIGLVLALFLASALFLGVMLYYVLQDIDRRQAEKQTDTARAAVHQVVHHMAPRGLPA
jgi:sensor domain CHASE-containing protein